MSWPRHGRRGIHTARKVLRVALLASQTRLTLRRSRLRDSAREALTAQRSRHVKELSGGARRALRERIPLAGARIAGGGNGSWRVALVALHFDDVAVCGVLAAPRRRGGLTRCGNHERAAGVARIDALRGVRPRAVRLTLQLPVSVPGGLNIPLVLLEGTICASFAIVHAQHV